MRTSLQQTFVPTGSREHRSKSNLDSITLANFKTCGETPALKDSLIRSLRNIKGIPNPIK